ncbi:MAG TPA: hypothetical protein VMT55_03750 [Candidatus Sulfotelmatobacter sp.]|nr:hypothetical protein [Candidatus Sulfotelmatobacter sp.]
MLRQIIFILLLLLAAGYAAFTYWPVIHKHHSAPVAATVTTMAAPAPAASTEAGSTAEASINERELVDPFSARVAASKKVLGPANPGENQPAQENSPPADLKLEGIWVDSGMKVAFISGQAVNLGAEISGWKVVAISKDNVVLQKGSFQKRLQVEELK